MAHKIQNNNSTTNKSRNTGSDKFSRRVRRENGNNLPTCEKSRNTPVPKKK